VVEEEGLVFLHVVRDDAQVEVPLARERAAVEHLGPVAYCALELREGVASIFREDEVVLEAQQQAIDDRPDYRFYNLNIDAGSMWARTLIDRLIERESSGAQRVIPVRSAA